MLNLKQENFEKEVYQSEKPVLVDFWASWCPPCQALHPILEELEKELTGIKIVKVNVDENPQLAESYKIEAIPTLLVFKEGQIVERITGLQEKESLIEKIKRFLEA